MRLITREYGMFMKNISHCYSTLLRDLKKHFSMNLFVSNINDSAWPHGSFRAQPGRLYHSFNYNKLIKTLVMCPTASPSRV